MKRDDLIPIATFQNPIDASVARGALEAAGIPAFVPGEHLGVFSVTRSNPDSSVELKVMARDHNRALKVLGRVGRQ